MGGPICTLVATGALAFRRLAPPATALTVAVAVAGPELFSVLTITRWSDFVPMLVAVVAAEDLLDRDPGAARQPLRAVQDTGQEAVAELGRMLGLLREEPAPDLLLPQPGVAQLPELVAQVRGAGLSVDHDVQGTAHDLPPGVDVALYRLTQEALTNVLKHARGARATAVLRYAETAVELRVEDDGRGVPAGPALGHGLIGMHERVALYGGTLKAGPREGGGFAVDAVLPLDLGARAHPA